MRTVATIVVLAAAAAGAADNLPRFEVATLKQSPPPEGDSYSIDLGTIRSGRLGLTNVTLSDCIKFAWGLVSDDQIAGPDWIRSKAVHFDIVAQVPDGTPHEQVLLMTQALLADRLKLILHREQKELRYLALVSAKDGPKMPVADSKTARDNSAGGGRVTGNHLSMPGLAMLLSRLERVLVIDKTGLTGEFQVSLRWVAGTGGPEMSSDNNATGASLFAAIQEQLGLRLESRKGPVDVVVVDRAEMVPGDN